jgi:hypothetical protein
LVSSLLHFLWDYILDENIPSNTTVIIAVGIQAYQGTSLNIAIPINNPVGMANNKAKK